MTKTRIEILKYHPRERNYAQYLEGRAAYAKGELVEDCPYIKNTLSEVAWLNGYSVGALDHAGIET